MDEATEFLAHVMHTRRTTQPHQLMAPGPDDRQLRLLFEAAASAPDHDQILPWRFTVVEASARERLADAFAQALRLRDPLAQARDLEEVRKKAFRAPLLMLLTVNIGPELGDVPPSERYLSAGCAVQNLLLQAQALGYGSCLSSNDAISSQPVRAFFKLSPADEPVCLVSVGTPMWLRHFKPRPKPAFFVRHLN